MTQQVAALGISRGAVYYEPRPTSVGDLTLMRRIDAIHLEHPWLGARMLKRELRTTYPGAYPRLGRRHVATSAR